MKTIQISARLLKPGDIFLSLRRESIRRVCLVSDGLVCLIDERDPMSQFVCNCYMLPTNTDHVGKAVSFTGDEQVKLIQLENKETLASVLVAYLAEPEASEVDEESIARLEANYVALANAT